MRKVIKVFLIIFVILVIIVLADTIQAKFFDNSPILKITENRNYGKAYKRDKGIFVYTYVFSDETKKTVFRWEKYAPPEEAVNLKQDIESESKMNFNINVVIDNKTYNAKLEENETAQNFINMLPQEYKMSELNGNEKYIYLDEKFPTNSYNPKHIEKGDIMLYGNNCLVVFYNSFDSSYSYTKIGHIENLENLGNEDIVIKFENK